VISWCASAAMSKICDLARCVSFYAQIALPCRVAVKDARVGARPQWLVLARARRTEEDMRDTDLFQLALGLGPP
jgi:hypothetical protein